MHSLWDIFNFLCLLEKNVYLLEFHFDILVATLHCIAPTTQSVAIFIQFFYLCDGRTWSLPSSLWQKHSSHQNIFNRKILSRLSESLESVGIKGTRKKAPILKNSVRWCCDVSGALNWTPMMPTDVSLSDDCAPERASLSMLVAIRISRPGR